MERPIIEINEEKCNGCGKCILDCAEGALAIVNGKAKLISDVYCDGLGACLNCPQGALSLKTREAPPFDEDLAMQAKMERELRAKPPLAPLVPKNIIKNLRHDLDREKELQDALAPSLVSWPLQLRLMPARASFLENKDILLAAQCTGFALPRLHEDWIKGRIPVICCPKLEDNRILIEKLAGILKGNKIRNITVLRMSVPCCNMEKIVREAQANSGKDIPWSVHSVPMR